MRETDQGEYWINISDGNSEGAQFQRRPDRFACTSDNVLLRFVCPTLILYATGAATVFVGSIVMFNVTKNDVYKDIGTSNFSLLVFGALSCALAWPIMRSSVRYILDLKAGNAVIAHAEGFRSSNRSGEVINRYTARNHDRSASKGFEPFNTTQMLVWLCLCGPVGITLYTVASILYYLLCCCCIGPVFSAIAECLSGLLCCTEAIVASMVDCYQNQVKPFMGVIGSVVLTLGAPLAITAAFAYGRDFVSDTHEAANLLQAFWTGEAILLPFVQVPLAYAYFKKVIVPLDEGRASPTRCVTEFFSSCSRTSASARHEGDFRHDAEGHPPAFNPSCPCDAGARSLAANGSNE